MKTLFVKLTFAFTCILMLLGFSVLWMSNRLSQQYFLEFTQQLNAPIAMYMAQNGNFIKDNSLNVEWLKELAPHVMMVNPSIEVYMLDETGKIIGSSPENEHIEVSRVSLEPIQRFLQTQHSLPILGDNPKQASQQRIFSTFPLYGNKSGEKNQPIKGYVYAVVAGDRYQSILGTLQGSYSFKSLVVTLAAALILALCGGIVVFLLLTRRLRKLTSEVSFRHVELFKRINISVSDMPKIRKSDELEQLTYAYQSMAKTLLSQYEQIAKQDIRRREFVENISHDLRTPLTTIQSYLETLILKEPQLSQTEKREYIDVAFRESQHLGKLVTQLFTLTRLESGEVKPAFEEFNLLELAHDAVQEFQLSVQSKRVQLFVQPVSSHGSQFDVYADIAMIQRVFENLLANAIRHTSKGRVTIKIQLADNEFVSVKIADTGCGMTKEQCRKIQNRYYSGADNIEILGEHSGLGLAIVKNVLKLHKANLTVDSKLGKGTVFSFTLTAAFSKAVCERKVADAIAQLA